MIIIEGNDATGKSTLGKALCAELSYDMKDSEGPPHSAEEITERIGRYYAHDFECPTIFVRHPCVSDPIYARVIREHSTIIPDRLIQQFYAHKHLFIYCRRAKQPDHQGKAGEDPVHLERINTRWHKISACYDAWAVHYAHFIYRFEEYDGKVPLYLTDMVHHYRLRDGLWS